MVLPVFSGSVIETVTVGSIVNIVGSVSNCSLVLVLL